MAQQAAPACILQRTRPKAAQRHAGRCSSQRYLLWTVTGGDLEINPSVEKRKTGYAVWRAHMGSLCIVQFVYVATFS